MVALQHWMLQLLKPRLGLPPMCLVAVATVAASSKHAGTADRNDVGMFAAIVAARAAAPAPRAGF